LLLLRIIKSFWSSPSHPNPSQPNPTHPIHSMYCVFWKVSTLWQPAAPAEPAPAARPSQARPIVGNDKPNSTNPCATLWLISHAISVFFWVFLGFFFLINFWTVFFFFFFFFKSQKQNHGKVLNFYLFIFLSFFLSNVNLLE
jgi:hypothetical protein